MGSARVGGDGSECLSEDFGFGRLCAAVRVDFGGGGYARVCGRWRGAAGCEGWFGLERARLGGRVRVSLEG